MYDFSTMEAIGAEVEWSTSGVVPVPLDETLNRPHCS